MFDIDHQPIFRRRVSLTVPGAGKEEFGATFAVLAVSEQAEFDLATQEGTRDFLSKAIVGLDDIVDHKGEPVPFSFELRDRLLDKGWTRQPLFDAYVAGLAEAVRGN